MLRVANVRNEAALEGVRDALDWLDVPYEHVRSEPDENTYPQTAYFYVPDRSADAVDNAMQRLAAQHGFDTELL